jgi:hypothetical protein
MVFLAGSGVEMPFLIRACRAPQPVQNAVMTRWIKWSLATLLVLAVLLAAGVLAVQRWMGTNDFKARAESEAASALGVVVILGAIDVDLWPALAVAVADVQVQTLPVLTLGRVEVRPSWAALWQGRLVLSTVVVRRAALAQQGVDALLVSLQKKKHTMLMKQGLQAENIPKNAPGDVPWAMRRVVLDDVTWLGAKGERITFDADVRLNADGLPDEVSAKVVKSQSGGLGALQGVQATVHRNAQVWTVAVNHLAGGTVKGQAELQPASQAGGAWVLKGQLDTRNVDVAAFGGGASVGPLSGRLEASTTLSARAASLGVLAEVLQTQSTFTVRNAVLHGIDLAKAVKTIGLSRGGETRLDVLAGQVQTRGKAIQVSNLVASSGVLSATGQVAIAPSRALSGRINVAVGTTVISGAMGVPLAVSGTLDAPEVTLTRSALIGAAIGTALLPGAGTGAGASLGDKVGDKLKGLFGR